jgi:hypothetical protein
MKKFGQNLGQSRGTIYLSTRNLLILMIRTRSTHSWGLSVVVQSPERSFAKAIPSVFHEFRTCIRPKILRYPIEGIQFPI